MTITYPQPAIKMKQSGLIIAFFMIINTGYSGANAQVPGPVTPNASKEAKALLKYL